MKEIIGRKVGMTSVFATDGTMYPVTVIEVLPNVILQKKTKEKDGYEALQVAIEDKKAQRVNKPLMGIFNKAKVSPKYFIKEIKGDEIYNHEVGENITVDIFQAGELVDVTGTSKGHGYSGVIKKYGKHIGPKGHGSGYHRQIGSLATNGRCNNRVHPGKKMSGHYGDVQRTVSNLTVVSVDASKNCILIKGSVPGPKKSVVKIKTSVKLPNKKVAVKDLVNYAA